MNKQARTLMVVTALSLALPGCSSIFGHRLFARAAPKAEIAQPPVAVAVADAATQLGRQHLDGGRDGQAIEAFQVAYANGEPNAPIFNGLGVAFSRLGRYELAQQYFTRAIAIAPQDQRFQANLARLMRSPAFALRHEGDMIAAASAAAAAAPVVRAEVQQAAAAPRTPGRLHRDGRNQFSIQTVEPLAAPVRTAAVSVNRRFKPLVRMQLPATDAAAEAPAQDEVRAPQPRTIGFKPVVRLTMPAAKD